MLLLENNINILVGGYYVGDNNWNNHHRVIDNCYKIYYIESGSLWIKDKDRTYNLKEGGLYLVNGHKLINYGATAFKLYWFHFTPQNSKLHYALNSLPAVSEVSQSIADQANIFEVFTPSFDVLLLKTSDMFQLMKLQYVIYSSILDTLKSNDINLDDDMLDFHKIEPAIKYIDEFYTRNISLCQMSELCHLSPSYFHKLFTSVMKETPSNYLLTKKMIMALSLINMNKNFKEVAFELGFCTDAHFSKTFKSFFGLTPGQYKKYFIING